MKGYHKPRIVIAGVSSGVGKTMIVSGLLEALTRQGKKVQSYKIGPDYIDPGFHKLASGRDSYNLDTWLTAGEELADFFAFTSEEADIAVIEGVMGLYDGGQNGISSTAEIAKRLQAPVFLVINGRSMGESAAAIAKGFRDYDPQVRIGGVILNQIGSVRHGQMIVEALERLDIPVLAVIHRNDELKTPERHLGLTPTTETDPAKPIHLMADILEKTMDFSLLWKEAEGAADLVIHDKSQCKKEPMVTIAVAWDEAFSFYYPASLQALEEEGANLVYFSPLRDEQVPVADGIIFGGGFPEMFQQDLQENDAMRKDIRKKAALGMPIYAECGGLMYLCESITDFEGVTREMVGIVPAKSYMQQKLQRVGYIQATSLQDTLLGPIDSVWKGHEFHFSTMEPSIEEFPWAFSMKGSRAKEPHLGGYSKGNILASYLHLSFSGSRKGAIHFIETCRQYKEKNHGK